MAPVSEDIHDLVAKLEQRVKDLESRLHLASGGASKQSGTAEGVRMILMGPPGAGMTSNATLLLSDILPRYTS
jgi:adenylate kinase